MIIDTHCHLDFPEFTEDLPLVMENARRAGVSVMINVASGVEGCAGGERLASAYKEVFFTIGVHPHNAGRVNRDDIKALAEKFRHSAKLVAVGEVGLDYYRDLSPRPKQEEVFRLFLGLKKELGLPVIVHSRNAGPETLSALKRETPVPIDGVMHCFSGDREYLGKVLDLGMHVSFTCNVTFDSAARLRDTLKHVPLDRLLLETDAPFLAPQKYRGQRNEPAYLECLVEAVSVIKGIDKEEVRNATTFNAKTLFGLEV
ncbi:MAG: TatD family hydrolase [Candidatus Omnitrophota bacterium]